MRAALYRVLARIGGAELVGPANELAAGTLLPASDGALMIRLASLALFVAAWWVAAQFAGARLLPDPLLVLDAIIARGAFRRAVLPSRRDTGARADGLHAGDGARHRDRRS